MKVQIFYTLTYETEAEVDDKFKVLLGDTLTPPQRHRLKQELLKVANDNIPMDGKLSNVWSDESEDSSELLASATIYAGPSAP